MQTSPLLDRINTRVRWNINTVASCYEGDRSLTKTMDISIHPPLLWLFKHSHRRTVILAALP